MRSKNNVHLFAASLTAALIVLRIFLHFYPDADFNIGAYNIHHLYTGAVILILSTLFLVNGFSSKPIIMASAIGSALIADQIVYLVATDGSNAAYSSSISLNGAVFLGIIAIFILYLLNLAKRK